MAVDLIILGKHQALFDDKEAALLIFISLVKILSKSIFN
jgi:hypothetical protein